MCAGKEVRLLNHPNHINGSDRINMIKDSAKYLKRKRYCRVVPSTPCKKRKINIIYSDSDDFVNQPSKTSTPLKKDSPVVRNNQVFG